MACMRFVSHPISMLVKTFEHLVDGQFYSLGNLNPSSRIEVGPRTGDQSECSEEPNKPPPVEQQI